MRVVSIYRTFDRNIDSGRSAVAELPVDEAEEEAIERWIALNGRELLKQMTLCAGAKLPAHRLDIPSESREPRRVPGGGASSPIWMALFLDSG
jgi:hypothetical protein